MKYGIDVPNFGDYADPHTLAALAHEAEQAGWDGFFIWDHINVGWSAPVVDPWIALAAIACATSRIRLGPMVTPLFRRAPWKVARESASLDHLSDGRLILGVGLGTDIFSEIRTFDGPAADQTRGAMLDEGLQVLEGLWSGKKFSFDGAHYKVREAEFLPPPVQQPRIPVWCAGTWPHKRPLRRAARYDGVFPMSGDIEAALKPADFRDIASFIAAIRTVKAPFDFVIGGESPANDRARAAAIAGEYEAAGVTWWMESTLPWKQPIASFRARIAAGPPRA